MKHYDLALVVGYHRNAAPFLSVIRELGSRLKIAVLSVDLDPSLQSKTGQAHLDFIDLCRSFGADILQLGEAAFATMTVFQQFPYDHVHVATILRTLQTERRAGLMTLAMAGIPIHDAFIEQFTIQKLFVPSLDFASFLLNAREAQARYHDVKMIEVGLPYAKYPVFPNFEADWIIAAPTLFSFHSESGKQQFLSSVLSLLDQIPEAKKVVYKPHNGNSRDYFAPRLYYLAAFIVRQLPGGRVLLQMAERCPVKWLRLHSSRIFTCILHQLVLSRCTLLTELTRSAGVSLEAYLPGVKEGVIGGLSNTIWGSLYFNLPYYNCVADSFRDGRSELLNKKSDELLDLNLQYFGIPFCKDDLSTDSRTLGIIKPEERNGDLIRSILSDITCNL